MRLISEEQHLFDLLKHNRYPDLVKARKPMSRWDCYSPKQRHRLELKCRTKHYDTLLIEKKKYDSIIQACKIHFDIPYYVCSTPLGVFLFNLFLVKADWEVNNRNPATTKFFFRNRVEKEVAYIHINQADKL
jgi:hypothetical protein|tara:strand:+ start:593 stop:988 length:396 start_codon:yes stop_codon:yes gene_type:complete